MDIGEREARRESAGKELNERVNKLGNLMKIFMEKVDSLDKTVHSLEVKVVDYIRDLNSAKDELEMQYATNKQAGRADYSKQQ